MILSSTVDEMQKRDGQYRKQQIERAEQLLKVDQPGPRRLNSAFKLSQILHEQRQQREAKEVKEHDDRLASIRDGQMLIAQAHQFIAEQQKQIVDYRTRCAEYRHMLSDEIANQHQRKLQLTQAMNNVAEMENAAYDKQLKETNEKEKRKQQQQRNRLADELRKTLQQTEEEKKRESIAFFIHFLN